jgi:hypothetical protein
MEKYIKSQSGTTKEKAEEGLRETPNEPNTQQTSTGTGTDDNPGYTNTERVTEGDTPNMPQKDEDAAGTGIPSAE